MLVIPLLAVAYSAINVVSVAGKTVRMHVYSDGVHTKMVDESGKSGSYSDESLQTRWQWGPEYGCIHLPMSAEKSGRKEDVLGTETIDGHPTRKVRVTSTYTDPKGKATTYSETVWRATDLQDLIIRASSDQHQMHLEKLVVGKPEASLVAFPSPPCNAAEMSSIAASKPAAPGGYRTVRFDQGACEFVMPFPIAMSIPSDYASRAVRPLGCFWGTEEDLNRLLANGREADFTAIKRGVFWCRPSESTEYDAAHKQFINEAGPQDKWAAAFRSMGAKDVVITSKPIGTFPSTRVTLTSNGQRVYMLYFVPPNVDTIALLINYHPAGKGTAADDEAWRKFVDSFAPVK
jgi:hypothetical protein